MCALLASATVLLFCNTISCRVELVFVKNMDFAQSTKSTIKSDEKSQSKSSSFPTPLEGTGKETHVRDLQSCISKGAAASCGADVVIETNSTSENVQLREGRRFSSFKELQDFIRKYKRKARQTFVITNSRSLKNPQVRKTCKPELEYFNIWFKCAHGKRQHASQSTGSRQTWTTKLGCNAFIKINVSEDGEYLQITQFNEEHNDHKETEAFYELLPKNKRLNSYERDEIVNLLKLRSDKKFIQDHTRDKFSKHLSMKDIHNIASSLIQKDDDSLSKAATILQETYGADVAVLHENGTFKGMYFSTKQMRDDMESWPEIVFIDGTYKLLKRNFTVMILLVKDSMGLSKVVGVALLAQEDRPTFQWFLNCFKQEHGTAWPKMQCMMGDKDLNERDVLKEVFPNIPIYICLFHTLRTFGREISREKMDISSEERTTSLHFLNSLAKSTSQQQYDAIYTKFSNEVPGTVLNYFNKNWHPIKHEWTKFSMNSGNLGNFTNNRLESVNSKIKQMVKKHSTMVAFVHSFFKWLNNREHEMLNKVSKNFLKKKVTDHESGSAELQYMKELTTFAFSIVEQEIAHHRAITIRKFDKNLETCLIMVHNVKIMTTPLTCECSAWKSSFLPCRHIFATRALFNLPLFAKELCPDRWRKCSILQTNPLVRNEVELSEDASPKVCNVNIIQCSPKKKLSDTQKRKKLTMIANDIVQMGMLSTAANFPQRLDILTQIRDAWRQGVEVCITKAHDDHTIIELEQDLQELQINRKAHSVHITEDDLDELVLPVPLKQKSRSRYTDMTIVKSSKKKNRPITFSVQTLENQTRMILRWLISDERIIQNALTGEYVIGEGDLPQKHEDLPDSIVASEVDLSVLTQYMTKTAFRKLNKIVQKRKDSSTWNCRSCNGNLSEFSILCDSCLCWYDYRCVNLKRAPKTKQWFCPSCKQ